MSTKKLSQIDTRIQKLMAEKNELVKNRSQEIAELITTINLTLIDEHVLVGALLSLKEDVINNTSNIEIWRQMGAKFFRNKSRTTNKLSNKVAA